jgi:predicted aminopeptidase
MKLAAWAAILICSLLVSGCDTVAYYKQAIGGHLEIMNSARPVEEWLADPKTPAALRERLQLARRIRVFASRELGLPENPSYTAYAELERPYVVWNVFAAPQFSVMPHKECFPFTGCVSYRGFFSEQDAWRHAEQLRLQGFDVHVGGVPAYSTLGWFDDPLLSTFIRYPDSQLARLVFHELAHQVVYARSDTTFNESFAVVVEEEGVRRWLESEGRPAELASFRDRQQRRKLFASRVKEARSRLSAIYKADLPRDELMRKKREEFDRLRADYPSLVPVQPSNAFLVAVALYNEQVPQFERLLAASDTLHDFYARVRELAKAGGTQAPLKPPGPTAARP